MLTGKYWLFVVILKWSLHIDFAAYFCYVFIYSVTQKSMKKLSEKVIAIHGEFVKYGRNAREWMRKCEMLLPHVERERVWEKKGFSSIYEYAAKLAGMGKNKVDVALWTMKKVEDKSELLKVVEEKGISAVRPIANMVTLENQSFWAEKAREMSMHTLEVYVKEFRKNENRSEDENEKCNGLFESKNNESSCRAARRVVGMDLEIEVVEELEKLKGREEWNTLMKEFLEMRRAKLEEEKPEVVKVVGKNEEGYHSRPAPAKTQKFVIKRTNGQCSFPGCNKPHEIKHHTDRFALKRKHDPDTYYPLCREHERLAHLGLIENEECEPKFWRIRAFADRSDTRWRIDEKVREFRRM